MNRVILASASPRRRELLEQIGVTFEIIPAMGEEVITGELPREVVMELAQQKAREVFERTAGMASGLHKTEDTDRIIIGADTVVAYDGQILGKPKDKKDAVRMLSMLSGNTHSVYTGVAIICWRDGKEQLLQFYEETKVTMYPMSELEIETYVNSGEPADKAGAYGIQGAGARYIARILGDYNNVVGLPVARIYQEMSHLGIDICRIS